MKKFYLTPEVEVIENVTPIMADQSIVTDPTKTGEQNKDGSASEAKFGFDDDED